MGSWKVVRGAVLGYELKTCGVYHVIGLEPPVKVGGTVAPSRPLRRSVGWFREGSRYGSTHVRSSAVTTSGEKIL
jgi:hypothetical protein